MTGSSSNRWLFVCVVLCLLSVSPRALAQDVAGPREWGWGSGDQRGAGNLITAEGVLKALSQVTEGEIIELSHDIAAGAPFIPGLQPEYELHMYLTSGLSSEMFARDMGATNGTGVNMEQVQMTMHVGTHLDALGHISIGDTLYGGASGEQVVSETGVNHGGIESAPPFIARAVLIDVAGYKGVERLEPGYAIQPSDLEGALRTEGVNVTEGTIVLIHTGSDDTFLNDPVGHVESSAGLSLAAARWLSSRRVLAVGADNHALEVQPGEVADVLFPVHQHLLVNQGIYIVENMKLDELAAREIYESTVIMLPAKFKGATGSPVRAIALR